MDINVPIENPELVRRIRNYTISQSNEDEKLLRQELLYARFLAPALAENGQVNTNGENGLNSDVKLNLMSIQDMENNVYLPAFTDWNEVRKWNSDERLKAIIFTFYDYVNLFMNNESMIGIVINSNGENLVINKQQMKAIASEGGLEIKETVKIGEPAQYPIDMSEALIEYFTARELISEAYLLMMVRENKEQSYLLVIDTDEDVNLIYPELAQIATKYLNKGEVIDFISSKEEFGKTAIHGHTPFYKR